MARQVATATRPRLGQLTHNREKREDGRHYVRCQLDSTNYESDVQERLDTMSYSDPTKPLYTIEADGRKQSERSVAGGSKMMLLSMSGEDYDLYMAENDSLAREGMEKVENTPDSFEKFERGGVISI